MTSLIRLVWGQYWTTSELSDSTPSSALSPRPELSKQRLQNLHSNRCGKSDANDESNGCDKSMGCDNTKRIIMRSTSEPLGRDTYRKYPLGPRTIIKEELSHLEKALISPDIRVRIADIKDWLVLQDYISEELEDEMVLAFLHRCYYDVKFTQKVIIKYFETQACLPGLLDFQLDSILQSQKSRAVLQNFYICPLDHSSSNVTIIFVKCRNSDPTSHDQFAYLRLLFGVTTMCVRENPVRDGFVVVFDSELLSFGHLKKGGLRASSVLHGYYQGGLPFRVKEVHIINASYLDITMLNLGVFTVPFLGPKMKDKIHLHKTRDMSRFVQSMGRENVPRDYEGGIAPYLEHLQGVTIDKLCEQSRLPELFGGIDFSLD